MKKKNNLITQRLSPSAFIEKKKRPFSLILDNIRSGHNVGAAFRLSDSFLLEHIYLCGITPKPPHPQVRKTALGAEMTMSWSHEESTVALLQRLKSEGYHIVAVELADPAIPLQKVQATLPKAPCALIFGHEVFGISDKALALVDACVEIPQHGTKFSMNVAMCMGIVVWEVLKDWPTEE